MKATARTTFHIISPSQRNGFSEESSLKCHILLRHRERKSARHEAEGAGEAPGGEAGLGAPEIECDFRITFDFSGRHHSTMLMPCLLAY